MKKFYLYILTFAICTSIWGCGKIDTDNQDNASNIKTSSNISPDTSLNTFNNTNTSNPDTSTGISSEDNTSVPGDAAESTPATSPEQKPEIKKADISVERPYTDANRSVTFLGLKEYKKIKGETYTDSPKNGSKYLVLFLSIKNNSYEENYINYNYFKAKLDGKKIEHTFLLNDPKNYPTIFTHIQPGGSIAGFIAWEVPNTWKELEITYNGWKDTDNISLNGSFTPKDLSSPLLYNANDYLNNKQN